MPWYLHAIGSEPETGASYATRDEALGARLDGYTVSRIVTPDESQTWRTREHERLTDGTYTRVPWHETLERLVRNYADTDDQVIAARRMLDHFAHVSLTDPGLMAYTPDEAKGADDKQTKIKPGKYLTDFATAIFTSSEITRFVAQVKAATSGLQFARTQDEIARVYSAKDSPTSCMDGRNFNFHECPARVYASPDLAVAFVGDITGDRANDSIAARAVVWPDKMIYSRPYGDTDQLEALLEANGYSSGSIRGARVLAIEDSNGRYRMPYVDDCYHADLQGDYFVLGRGDYDCRNTDGYANGGNTCANCGESCDDDESYCSSCEENSYFCDSCEETQFDDSPNCHDHGTLCDSCDSDHTHTCEHCEESFNDYDFSRGLRRNRDMSLCSNCEDTVSKCADCDSWIDNDDLRQHRDDLVCGDCFTQRNCRAPRPHGRLIRRHVAGASYVQIPISDGSFPVAVEATVIGCFAVHPTLTGARVGLTTAWTVTHVPTGKSVVTYAPNARVATDLVNRLSRDGRDWTSPDVDTLETLHTEYARTQINSWRAAHNVSRY